MIPSIAKHITKSNDVRQKQVRREKQSYFELKREEKRKDLRGKRKMHCVSHNMPHFAIEKPCQAVQWTKLED